MKVKVRVIAAENGKIGIMVDGDQGLTPAQAQEAVKRVMAQLGASVKLTDVSAIEQHLHVTGFEAIHNAAHATDKD